MSNIIETLTLLDGTDKGRNIVVKVNIIGDGSGEEILTKIFSASDYSNTTVNKKAFSVQYCLNGFNASLYWGVGGYPSTNLILACQEDHYDKQSFLSTVNNINNMTIDDRDGDIYISTKGLDQQDAGYLIIEIKNGRYEQGFTPVPPSDYLLLDNSGAVLLDNTEVPLITL